MRLPSSKQGTRGEQMLCLKLRTAQVMHPGLPCYSLHHGLPPRLARVAALLTSAPNCCSYPWWAAPPLLLLPFQHGKLHQWWDRLQDAGKKVRHQSKLPSPTTKGPPILGHQGMLQQQVSAIPKQTPLLLPKLALPCSKGTPGQRATSCPLVIPLCRQRRWQTLLPGVFSSESWAYNCLM